MKDVFEGIGVLAVVGGVAFWSIPAAIVLLGIAVIAACEVRS